MKPSGVSSMSNDKLKPTQVIEWHKKILGFIDRKTSMYTKEMKQTFVPLVKETSRIKDEFLALSIENRELRAKQCNCDCIREPGHGLSIETKRAD